MCVCAYCVVLCLGSVVRSGWNIIRKCVCVCEHWLEREREGKPAATTTTQSIYSIRLGTEVIKVINY